MTKFYISVQPCGSVMLTLWVKLVFCPDGSVLGLNLMVWPNVLFYHSPVARTSCLTLFFDGSVVQPHDWVLWFGPEARCGLTLWFPPSKDHSGSVRRGSADLFQDVLDWVHIWVHCCVSHLQVHASGFRFIGLNVACERGVFQKINWRDLVWLVQWWW